jgi:hypothetical protein
MLISIESPTKSIRSFPNKNVENAHWYVSEQPALLFKNDSKYPDKFLITLSFSGAEKDALSSTPFPAGDYELADEAFRINRNNGIDLDLSKLTLIEG